MEMFIFGLLIYRELWQQRRDLQRRLLQQEPASLISSTSLKSHPLAELMHNVIASYLKAALKYGVTLLWVCLCQQEVLAVWGVSAWEDPFSVPGLFILYSPLCSNASESKCSSRKDLVSI